MAIDFTLTPAQKALQKSAREFAQDCLKPVVQNADLEPDTQKAFQMMRGPYEESYRLGFAMGFLPKKYGGGSVSNVDLQLVAEEITSVDPGFATVLLVNGLGLMPVAWYGSEEQKKKWIGEATSDPTHSYLAGWTVSEPAGPQSGTANFDHPGAHPAGIGVIAELDKGRGEWVLNGRKKWPCNSGGWDLKGANVNIVIVRCLSGRTGELGCCAWKQLARFEGVGWCKASRSARSLGIWGYRATRSSVHCVRREIRLSIDARASRGRS
jgi:alkylation response protein AidB-like acyl-CoA dehydrogenase